MKSLKFILIAACLVSMAACQQAPNADEAKVSDAKEVKSQERGNNVKNYKVNTTDSRITFTGTKPTGQHKGYFNLQGGSITMAGDNVQGGNFSVDIPSMTIIDAMPVEMANNLKGHLLSEEFFKSEKFPVATFNITSVKPIGDAANVKLAGATHNIEGNLRLLDKTKSISFPAVIRTSGESMKASANFNINRADFGMVYGNDESLGDKFISPMVNIVIRLIANQ